MRVVRAGARREVVPSGLLGMVIFVGTEVMFFAGLISAFTISKAGAPRGAWSLPAGQVLPLASTAVNTAALFASGALLWAAGRQYRARSSAATQTLLAATVLWHAPDASWLLVVLALFLPVIRVVQMMT